MHRVYDSQAGEGSEQPDFFRAQGPVLAGGELAVEHQWPDALPVQTHNLVVEVAKHAFDLVVTPFDDTQASTAGAQQLEPGGLRGQVFIGEINAFIALGYLLGANHLLGLNVIHLGHFGLRLGQMA